MFYNSNKMQTKLSKSIKGEEPPAGIVSVSANPTEGERTFKVSLVSRVGSRPVRVINGDLVSEFPHFLNFQF